MNEELISDIITQTLNEKYDILKTLADESSFIDIVTEAAKNWAIECYVNDLNNS